MRRKRLKSDTRQYLTSDVPVQPLKLTIINGFSARAYPLTGLVGLYAPGYNWAEAGQDWV